MPLRPFCDDDACGAPLEGKPLIAIPHIVIKESDTKQGEAKSLFFCDEGCLRSWVVKNKNRPQIIGPAQ